MIWMTNWRTSSTWIILYYPWPMEAVRCMFYNTFYSLDGRNIFANAIQHMYVYWGVSYKELETHEQKTLKQIKKHKPDIVGLVEVMNWEQLKTLKKWLKSAWYITKASVGEDLWFNNKKSCCLLAYKPHFNFKRRKRNLPPDNKSRGMGSDAIWVYDEEKDFHYIIMHLSNWRFSPHHRSIQAQQIEHIVTCLNQQKKHDNFIVMWDFNLHKKKFHNKIVNPLRWYTAISHDSYVLANKNTLTKRIFESKIDHILVRNLSINASFASTWISDHKALIIDCKLRKKTTKN